MMPSFAKVSLSLKSRWKRRNRRVHVETSQTKVRIDGRGCFEDGFILNVTGLCKPSAPSSSGITPRHVLDQSPKLQRQSGLLTKLCRSRVPVRQRLNGISSSQHMAARKCMFPVQAHMANASQQVTDMDSVASSSTFLPEIHEQVSREVNALVSFSSELLHVVLHGGNVKSWFGSWSGEDPLESFAELSTALCPSPSNDMRAFGKFMWIREHAIWPRNTNLESMADVVKVSDTRIVVAGIRAGNVEKGRLLDAVKLGHVAILGQQVTMDALRLLPWTYKARLIVASESPANWTSFVAMYMGLKYGCFGFPPVTRASRRVTGSPVILANNQRDRENGLDTTTMVEEHLGIRNADVQSVNLHIYVSYFLLAIVVSLLSIGLER